MAWLPAGGRLTTSPRGAAPARAQQELPDGAAAVAAGLQPDKAPRRGGVNAAALPGGPGGSVVPLFGLVVVTDGNPASVEAQRANLALNAPLRSPRPLLL